MQAEFVISVIRGGCYMDNKIIVIRAPDPDGRILKSILDILDSNAEKVSLIAGKDMELVFPGLQIKIQSATVFRDDQQVLLNRGEYSTLCHMARCPGYVFSKEQLYSAVYGEDRHSVATVPSTICRLRKKIETDPKSPIYIRTVIGIGYKFEFPAEIALEEDPIEQISVPLDAETAALSRALVQLKERDRYIFFARMLDEKDFQVLATELGMDCKDTAAAYYQVIAKIKKGLRGKS